MKRLLLILYVICLPSLLLAKGRIIVTCQDDFDHLGERIKTALQKERGTVEVIIKAGDYIYKEKHILLKGIEAPKVKLVIRGSGANLFPVGEMYHNGDSYVERFSINRAFVTTNGKNVRLWTEMRTVNELVEVVNESEKLCRLRCMELHDMSENEVKHVFIRIPHWFLSSSYRVKKIEKGYIYFIAQDLEKSTLGGWNINDDYNYSRKKEIRYMLCNVSADNSRLSFICDLVKMPKGVDALRECTVGNFLFFTDCLFKEVCISGLNIMAAAYFDSGVIELRNLKTKGTLIENCLFRNMKCEVVKIKNSPNVTVRSCSFDYCYKDVISSDNGSTNTIVAGCTFMNLGLDMENSAGVRCIGSQFRISNNYFRDYGYSAISTGGNASIEYNHPITGIIENNRLLYTQDYCKQKENKTLMDGGAIYVSTKTDGVVISGNYISNYTGMADNRAVFCDDGARNVTICGNIITGTENSYSIDSRRVASVESVAGPVNVGNRIYGNVVDSRIRFAVNETAANKCELGKNFFLIDAGGVLPENQYEKIDSAGVDVIIEKRGVKGDRIIVSRGDAKTIKKSASWKSLKKCLSIK